MSSKNRHFIDWSMKILKSGIGYYLLVLLAMILCFGFLIFMPFKVIPLLEKKLIKGAKDHGIPVYPLSVPLKELVFEYLDIVGWLLVLFYNVQIAIRNVSKPKKV